MAEFVCKIGTANGEIMQKVLVADSEKTLRQQMTEQGYYIFGIEQKFNAAAALKGLFSFSRKKVTDKEFLIFNQELAALIRSGLPLLQCLDLVVERSDNPDFTEHFGRRAQTCKVGGFAFRCIRVSSRCVPERLHRQYSGRRKERNAGTGHSQIFDLCQDHHGHPDQSRLQHDLSIAVVLPFYGRHWCVVDVCHSEILGFLQRFRRGIADDHNDSGDDSVFMKGHINGFLWLIAALIAF